jgi:HlyD family secretion protein
MLAMEVQRKSVSMVLVALVTGSLVLAGVQWQKLRSLQAIAGTTEASAAEPPSSLRIRAEGHLVAYPGAEVTVGTDVGGTIQSLPVFEKMHVRKGELLAEIDASEQKAAYAEARARVKEAEVDMKLFDVELKRSNHLFATDAVAQDTVDRSEHDLSGAEARKETAAATAWRLGTIVAKTRIVAPIDGTVTARIAEAGQTVSQGAPLVTLCDLSRTRIEAEVDEYDALRMTLGAEAAIKVEGSEGRTWTGKVEEIPDTVTSRRLKPEDPGHPTDTRVLLVKIALLEPTPIKLGQRVEVEIKAPALQ